MAGEPSVSAVNLSRKASNASVYICRCRSSVASSAGASSAGSGIMAHAQSSSADRPPFRRF